MHAGKLVVVGCQWGDEGKGKIVDMLAENTDAVVRYQGGHNAGHTIEVGDTKIVLHLIPSGIMHKKNTCYISQGVVVSLEALEKEIQTLEQKGIPVIDKLKISYNCPLVLPTHKEIDLAREEKASKNNDSIGTTGRGIGPAYEDKIARRSIKVGDILNEELLQKKLEPLLEYQNFILTNYFGRKSFNYNEVYQGLLSYQPLIKQIIGDVNSDLYKLASNDEANIIFEGAQGTLLDIDNGTYPFVTSSNTIATAAGISVGISPQAFDNVLGICKAYCTRVGMGPFPTELYDETGDFLQTEGGEFGATTGRKRRCGWLDLVALKHAVRLNGITSICLTKLDVLNKLKTIKVCTKYELNGKLLEHYPENPEEVINCKPVYEELSGWQQDISRIKLFAELPDLAKQYIKFIENYLQIKVSIVSVGKDRNETIFLE